MIAALVYKANVRFFLVDADPFAPVKVRNRILPIFIPGF
jgi:hypothetical protein